MDQNDHFDSVSWKQDVASDSSRPTTSGTDVDTSEGYTHDHNGKRRMSYAPEEAPPTQLIDDGILECRVDSPLKENDGTKDTFISYLVTTHVCCNGWLWRYCCFSVLTWINQNKV